MQTEDEFIQVLALEQHVEAEPAENWSDFALSSLKPSITLINLLNKLGRVKCQVYACKSVATAFGVATYLARYLRGGAPKNHQILGIKAEQVLFKYRDHHTHKMVSSRYSIADVLQDEK